MTETSGPGSFLIEVGPEPWSSELSKECYSAHEVFAAIEDHLNDYAVRHQEHKDVVGKVLAYLPDYWNRL